MFRNLKKPKKPVQLKKKSNFFGNCPTIVYDPYHTINQSLKTLNARRNTDTSWIEPKI